MLPKQTKPIDSNPDSRNRHTYMGASFFFKGGTIETWTKDSLYNKWVGSC